MTTSRLLEREIERRRFCLPVRQYLIKEHVYLFSKDMAYEAFVSKFGRTLLALEDQMKAADKKMKNIPTPGATSMDKKSLLAAFYILIIGH